MKIKDRRTPQERKRQLQSIADSYQNDPQGICDDPERDSRPIADDEPENTTVPYIWRISEQIQLPSYHRSYEILDPDWRLVHVAENLDQAIRFLMNGEVETALLHTATTIALISPIDCIDVEQLPEPHAEWRHGTGHAWPNEPEEVAD